MNFAMHLIITLVIDVLVYSYFLQVGNENHFDQIPTIPKLETLLYIFTM